MGHFVEIGFYRHYLLFRAIVLLGFHVRLLVAISLSFFMPESELCMTLMCLLSRRALNVESDL